MLELFLRKEGRNVSYQAMHYRVSPEFSTALGFVRRVDMQESRGQLRLPMVAGELGDQLGPAVQLLAHLRLQRRPDGRGHQPQRPGPVHAQHEHQRQRDRGDGALRRDRLRSAPLQPRRRRQHQPAILVRRLHEHRQADPVYRGAVSRRRPERRPLHHASPRLAPPIADRDQHEPIRGSPDRPRSVQRQDPARADHLSVHRTAS